MKIKNKKTGIAIMMAAMTMMAAGCSATGSQKGNSASGNTIKVGVNMENCLARPLAMVNKKKTGSSLPFTTSTKKAVLRLTARR